MSSPSNTYNKQNSFVDIRRHKTLEDIIPRIRNLKGRLHTLSLPDYKKNIVHSLHALNCWMKLLLKRI
jgi:hypothetical protein